MLKGTHGTGLLVTYEVLPSARAGGQYQQVFGVVRGALVPFSKPFSTAGGRDVEPIWRSRAHLLSDPPADALEFRVWTGNFFVIVSLSIDWLAGNSVGLEGVTRAFHALTTSVVSCIDGLNPRWYQSRTLGRFESSAQEIPPPPPPHGAPARIHNLSEEDE